MQLGALGAGAQRRLGGKSGLGNGPNEHYGKNRSLPSFHSRKREARIRVIRGFNWVVAPWTSAVMRFRIKR
jgi:hypothetical protein